ncbi:MAG: transcriptional regulator [Alphaproteobacteria bacterium]|nr:transcriptional regulator [Alphaproteobacteria bacterium]
MSSKPYHYRESGLDYVYLQNGFTYHETPYGKGVSIFAADQLHEAIAREIVLSPRPLRGQEARFLRSLLDISQADLARTMGTTRISITRWEKNRDGELPGTADTALRLIYTGNGDKTSLVKRTMDMLRERDDAAHGRKAPKKKITLKTRGGVWDTARAA